MHLHGGLMLVVVVSLDIAEKLSDISMLRERFSRCLQERLASHGLESADDVVFILQPRCISKGIANPSLNQYTFNEGVNVSNLQFDFPARFVLRGESGGG